MFRRSKDTNKAAPQGTSAPQPQFPTDDDRLVAEATVFLLDGGQEDAADILLSSTVHLVPHGVHSYSYSDLSSSDLLSGRDRWSTLNGKGYEVGVLQVQLTAPRQAFDTMNNGQAPERTAITAAFKAVWSPLYGRPGGDLSWSDQGVIRFDSSGRPIQPVYFGITYGRTDPAYQAKMTQLVKSMTANYRKVEGIQVVQQGEPITLRPIPVFPTGPFERDDTLCFVIMPFATQFQAVYADGIKPGVISAGLRCQRGDDIMQPGDILSQIWGGLMAARFLVADVTGANGNVLYELGLAHVVGHQAILLTQNMNDVPFDLRQQRHIVYMPTPEGLQKLQADLRMALQQLVAAHPRA